MKELVFLFRNSDEIVNAMEELDEETKTEVLNKFFMNAEYCTVVIDLETMQARVQTNY